MASFLKPHEPTSASFTFFFLQLPHLSQPFIERKRGQTLLWIRRCWLNLLSRPRKLSPRQQEGFLVICVYWCSAFNCLQELLLCIHSLADWHKRPSFWSALTFNTPSSPSLIISSLGLKGRDVWVFLSLVHLEVSVGLLIGLLSFIFLSFKKIFQFLYLRGGWAEKEGERESQAGSAMSAQRPTQRALSHKPGDCDLSWNQEPDA